MTEMTKKIEITIFIDDSNAQAELYDMFNLLLSYLQYVKFKIVKS